MILLGIGLEVIGQQLSSDPARFALPSIVFAVTGFAVVIVGVVLIWRA